MKNLALISVGMVLGAWLHWKFAPAKLESREEHAEVSNERVVKKEPLPEPGLVDAPSLPDASATAAVVEAPPPAPDTAAASAAGQSSKPRELQLADLKPSDILHWEELWREKVGAYLSGESKIWKAGDNAANSGRVRQDILEATSGRYEFKIKPILPQGSDLTATLNLTQIARAEGENSIRLTLRSAAGRKTTRRSYSSTLTAPRDFGTDMESRAVHVIWENSMPELPGYSQLAIQVPAHMRTGDVTTVDFWALFEDMTWKSLGEGQLTRTR